MEKHANVILTDLSDTSKAMLGLKCRDKLQFVSPPKPDQSTLLQKQFIKKKNNGINLCVCYLFFLC